MWFLKVQSRSRVINGICLFSQHVRQDIREMYGTHCELTFGDVSATLVLVRNGETLGDGPLLWPLRYSV